MAAGVYCTNTCNACFCQCMYLIGQYLLGIGYVSDIFRIFFGYVSDIPSDDQILLLDLLMKSDIQKNPPITKQPLIKVLSLQGPGTHFFAKFNNVNCVQKRKKYQIFHNNNGFDFTAKLTSKYKLWEFALHIFGAIWNRVHINKE